MLPSILRRLATADSYSSPENFLTRWSNAAPSERANAQLFLSELADLLGVPRPGNDHASGYTFELPVKIPTGPGLTTDGRIDLYRRGYFVLEAKQFVAPKAEQTDLELAAVSSGAVDAKKKSGPIRGSDAWDDAMWRAKGQAERYARHLPESEPAAPFLLVVDVGHSIEVYADFTGRPRVGGQVAFDLQLEGLLEITRGVLARDARDGWLSPGSQVMEPSRSARHVAPLKVGATSCCPLVAMAVLTGYPAW